VLLITRIKSQYPLGNSDRKKLKQRLVLHDESFRQKMDAVFAKDSTIVLVKIKSYKDDSCSIYKVGEDPLLFEYENILYPTVYLLWQVCFISCIGIYILL
jgi:predicted ribosome-associated RNA-binding protein Tma20